MKNYTSYDLIEWGNHTLKSQHALPEPTLSEVLIRVTAQDFVIPICICRRGIWILVKKGG